MRSHSAPGRASSTPVQRLLAAGGAPTNTDTDTDTVADEAPLEIQVADADGPYRALAVVMRTRGADGDDGADDDADDADDADDLDLDLATGFLFAEHVIDSIDDLTHLAHCTVAPSADAEGNVVQARLRAGRRVDWARLRRHTFSSSSCGVCGKASIDAVVDERRRGSSSRPLSPPLSPALSLERAQAMLQAAAQHQRLFAMTGGCHGAAVVDNDGVVVVAREDVGRHNAVDKVIGALLRAHAPRHNTSDLSLVLSGRVAFELVQKAARFGFGSIVAKGAPSSLAVELAAAAGIQLVGFVKAASANRYA